MTTIYELYEALLTIKEFCASKIHARNAHSLIVLIAAFFIKDTASSNWKLVEPTRRLYE